MVSDLSPTLDCQGHLQDFQAWNPQVAAWFAGAENIILQDEHWQIIDLVREFYLRTDISPDMRPLVKMVRQALGDDCGNSIYLMQRFGSNPARSVARIAGLPKPSNCL